MTPIEIEFPDGQLYTREWLEEHPDDAQQLLRRCKGSYPRCLCQPPGQSLYIAHRARFYLARLPNTGPHHAPTCPSYEPETAWCGRGLYSAKALEDRGDSLHVKLAAPLAIRGGQMAEPRAVSAQVSTAHTARDALGLRGLLHLLWERAEFSRWRPTMQGRRHYRQVYKYLLEAAESMWVRRQTLTRHLYIPEPYDANQRLQIEARRQRALSERSSTASGAPLRVLVAGQVRSIIPMEAAQDGIRLAHVPQEFVIRASRATLSRLRQETEFAWLDWPNLYSEFRLMVLFTMQRNREGQWAVEDLAGMVTTSEYIPVLSMEDALLAQQLLQQSRTFCKPLPYDGPACRLPAYLLLDCGSRAVPLEVIGHQDAEIAVQLSRIEQYHEQGTVHWQWDYRDTPAPPPLPVTCH